MHLDGTEVYDVDASQIGLNLLTSDEYANYTELLALGWRAINETSGYGTYSFVPELGDKQVVCKECFWTTVGAETIKWRLFLADQL